jgi:hypothetical protein
MVFTKGACTSGTFSERFAELQKAQQGHCRDTRACPCISNSDLRELCGSRRGEEVHKRVLKRTFHLLHELCVTVTACKTLAVLEARAGPFVPPRRRQRASA